MSIKSKNKRVQVCLIVVTACPVLAAISAVLATPETVLAAQPSKETIRFHVTTPDPLESDIVIVGTFDSSQSDRIAEGPAEGRAGKSDVVVNRPSPAIQMDFLAPLDCFTAGDIYSLDHGGTLEILQSSKGAFIRYFFRARGKDGELTSYRIDADAEIDSDNGFSFPKDDSGYTVTVSNIRVSVDAGPRANGCESSFPDASANIRLDRIQ